MHDLECPRCGLEKDYIPKGTSVDGVDNIRPADGFYQCGMSVGNDIQSGPIYCGKKATVIADPYIRDYKWWDEDLGMYRFVKTGGIVACCNRHKENLEDFQERMKKLIKEAEDRFEENKKQRYANDMWDGDI